MTKYLVVFQLEYCAKVNDIKRWYKGIYNSFFFFERYPIYSVIIEKLIKEHKQEDYLSFSVVLLGIYPLENEPSDLEGKKVIKIGE